MASIDVVVPCYQYGHYLRDCVSSILAQDVANLRVLIIDNGSTDNSLAVARALAAQDSRVSVVTDARNRGRHAAYNEGLDWVAADYFLLIDADDALAPGALRRALEVLERNQGISFAYGAELLATFEAGSIPDIAPAASTWNVCQGRSFIEAACRSGDNPVGTSTVVRRTSMQKQVGYYSTDYRHTDDVDMWLRLAMVGDVAATGSIQAIRRVHPGQISEAMRERPILECKELCLTLLSFLDRNAARFDDPASLRSATKRGLARTIMGRARPLLEERNARAADELVMLALRLSPCVAIPRIARRFWLYALPLSRPWRLLRAMAGAVGTSLTLPADRSGGAGLTNTY